MGERHLIQLSPLSEAESHACTDPTAEGLGAAPVREGVGRAHPLEAGARQRKSPRKGTVGVERFDRRAW